MKRNGSGDKRCFHLIMWFLTALKKWRKMGIFVRAARQISLGSLMSQVVALTGVG